VVDAHAHHAGEIIFFRQVDSVAVVRTVKPDAVEPKAVDRVVVVGGV
jgi:hypothetical protein